MSLERGGSSPVCSSFHKTAMFSGHERGMLRVKSSLILLINALSLLHLYCKAMSWPHLPCLLCELCQTLRCMKRTTSFYLLFFKEPWPTCKFLVSLYCIISGWRLWHTRPSLFKQYFTLYKSSEGSFAHRYWKTQFLKGSSKVYNYSKEK